MKKFVASMAMLGCFAAAAQADLVSYWPFDEFPNEESTPDVVSGHDMLVESNGIFDSENHVDGKFGKAFQFYNSADAAGDESLLYYTSEPDDLLPINLQPEFTISMWTNVKGTGQNDLRLFSESNSLDGNGNPLFNIGTANNGADDTLDIYIRNNQLSTGTINHPHTTAEPFNGEWNHVGWTYADGMHNVWVNGVLDSSYEMQSFGEIDPVNIDTTTIGGILRDNASHWVTGIIDEVAVWNEVLAPNQMAGLAQELTTPQEALDFTQDIRPRIEIDGVVGLPSEISNQQFSEPTEGQGLAGYWYDGNMRNNIDAFLDARDAGPGTTADFPLVSGPFNADGTAGVRSESTWWVGGGNPNVVSDLTLPRYPEGIAGQIAGGSAENHDNYGVILQGEIFIEENGEYYLRDGIDDFAMVAIDQDGDGELADIGDISDLDSGLLGIDNAIGDVLILDDDWANINGGGQAEDFHGSANFEDIDDGGEWRKIEIWMSEAGGGDAGILYMGKSDDPNLFDEIETGDLTQEQRDEFVVRPERLRGVGVTAGGADATGQLLDSVEYVMSVGGDSSDQFTIDDNGGLYNTTIDVSDVTISIEAADGIEPGTEFTLFDADNIVGDDSLTLNFEDASQWSYSNGVLTFGDGPGCNSETMGDANGDGMVAFDDFLVLSTNFGQEVASHEQGDFNCDGMVAFDDFLVLSTNFGQAVGAQSVPEPSGFFLFGFAGLLGGLVRRRRG